MSDVDWQQLQSAGESSRMVGRLAADNIEESDSKYLVNLESRPMRVFTLHGKGMEVGSGTHV